MINRYLKKGNRMINVRTEHLSRTLFTQGVFSEIRVVMSLFMVKNYASFF